MVLAKVENAPVHKLFDMTGKVVAVTGGGKGIGFQVCTAFVEAGAQVAILYNETTTAPETASALEAAHNIKCRTFRANVRSASEVTSALDQVVAEFGKLDVIVANAGITSNHAAEDYTLEEFHEVIDINFNGAYYTASAAARIFKKQGFGNVIFTASISATLVNFPQRQAAYNASKAAVVQLARTLAVEWVDFCRVNSVSPGYTQTDILNFASQEMREEWLRSTPGRRFASPYEMKGVYLFCASDASSYMTGSNIVVDGGLTLP